MLSEFFHKMLYLKDELKIGDFDVRNIGLKLIRSSIKRKYHPMSNFELSVLVKNENVCLKDIDTSDVEDMSYLFENSNRKDFSGIEWWDVSNVKDMDGMFRGCEEFNVDVSDWDVSKVKYMREMFKDCKKFNQPLDKWNVSRVNDIDSMFENCESFNQDLSNWNLKSLERASRVFKDCVSLNQDFVSWVCLYRDSVVADDVFSGCVKQDMELTPFNSIYKECLKK